MKITILGCGTSTGVPVIGCHCEVCSSPDPLDRRTRSSILVNS
ncbi:MAG TPA: MBL fold metallo-hydrolase, partial [Thermodesulfobacteriota bacterium]